MKLFLNFASDIKFYLNQLKNEIFMKRGCIDIPHVILIRVQFCMIHLLVENRTL